MKSYRLRAIFGSIATLFILTLLFFKTQVKVPVYRQTGIMAFRKEALIQFSALPETALERAESVDMLRPIEHGMRIAGVVVDYVTIGVDRPSDVTLVESVIQHNPVQHALFQSITR